MIGPGLPIYKSVTDFYCNNRTVVLQIGTACVFNLPGGAIRSKAGCHHTGCEEVQ